MCGIWASLGFEPDRKHIELVAHRGPDGDGWREFAEPGGPVALGHRRLAILDVSDAGLQPMTDASRGLWMVFNGEIYNYRELREQLVAAGHAFTTGTDSEVLLAGYREWGEECVQRFIGMFAFVILDLDQHRVFAARDRFGIKPLYFHASDSGVAFASEIKQLLPLPGLGRRINLPLAYDFLSSGITDHSDECLFQGIRQLRPGECTSLSTTTPATASSLHMRRWYALPEPGSIQLSEGEAADRFRELMEDSVRLHLRSDVRVGSCLSGGLDSSSIVCIADRLLAEGGASEPFNTVSACYQGSPVDERVHVDEVVRATGVQPHYVYPSAGDAFDLAESITWHQDEPYGSTSIFAQWEVFRTAREAGITVMLDGQGADEQLAGYHGGFGYYYSSLLRGWRLMMLIRAMRERQDYHGLPVKDQLRTLVGPLLPGILRHFLFRQRQAYTQHDWLGSEAFRGQDFVGSAFDKAVRREGLPPVNGIGDLCVAMTRCTNLPMLLRYEDRNSMAHGIEARVPFLDHRLVDFTIGLGDEHKIVGGDTKRVLRRAMSGLLPDATRLRRDKLGFTTPEEAWFRGPLREAVIDGVEETLRRFPALLNPEGTRAFRDDVLDGRRPVDFTVWRIVNMGIWGRVFGVSL